MSSSFTGSDGRWPASSSGIVADIIIRDERRTKMRIRQTAIFVALLLAAAAAAGPASAGGQVSSHNPAKPNGRGPDIAPPIGGDARVPGSPSGQHIIDEINRPLTDKEMQIAIEKTQRNSNVPDYYPDQGQR
jgi:hypothetical protein